MAYDFSLDRKATITVSASSILLLLLVFAAGVLTGVNWRTEREMMAAGRNPVAAPTAQVVSTQSAAARERGEAAGPPPAPAAPPAAVLTAAPAQVPATGAAELPPPVEAAASAPPAGAAPQAPTTEPTTRVTMPSGVQLAVQVGSFLEKANAEKLAARLKEEGYAPQIVLGGHAPRQWNIVRVGPYRDWDEASEIAMVLSRDQATPAVIRPMR